MNDWDMYRLQEQLQELESEIESAEGWLAVSLRVSITKCEEAIRHEAKH